ncbi:IS1595 family transposase [Rhodoplanes sp. Z2-YC6860]|uniref:IS1595 family transposase n=1 Tax=Rhodoplanes sp. Z2-YC6860 TaxID=674703 RepID=UPI00078D192A|nr:IS1595 family transposase [Rhodoplanes sp. Z2-YC6860]AMN38743.1 ISSpo8, transposase [Rhodoplanes sp. Z2-YC6860]
MSLLNRKYFQDEQAAFDHLEAILWDEGTICPHCGVLGKSGKLEGVKDKKGRVRLGLWKCYSKPCRKQFTVRVGTVFESAHIPLHKMLQAVYLMSASKKGVSAHQLHRTLEITYKSAWFLAHRIREAMRDGTLAPMGGEGSTIEADETFIGRLKGVPKQRSGYAHKNAVLTLVERGGSARSFHVDNASVATIMPIVRTNVRRESKLMTDEAQHYMTLGHEFAEHGSVKHKADEYVRGDVHTNTVEGFYSIFKRGMKGVYQHCSEKHLHRYLAEFDFRYNNRVRLGVNDEQRSNKAMQGIFGKRLTYRQPGSI